MNKFRASCFILGAAFFWSLGGFLIKGMSWDSLTIAGVRSLIAGLIFLGLFYRKISPKWSLTVVVGAFFYAATVISFVMATKLTSSANAIVLQYAAPIYLALVSPWLLHEKIFGYDWLAIALGLLGVLLTLQSDLKFSLNLGNSLGLLSGILFAGLIICMRKLGKKGNDTYATLEVVLLGNLLAAFTCLVAMRSQPILTFENSWRMMCLGTLQMALPYVLYSRGISFLPAMDATLLQMVEPILNPIWVFLILQERPSINTIWGGFIILGATLLRLYFQNVRFSKISDKLKT